MGLRPPIFDAGLHVLGRGSHPPTRARCRKQRLRRYSGCAPADALDALIAATLPCADLPPSTERSTRVCRRLLLSVLLLCIRRRARPTVVLLLPCVRHSTDLLLFSRRRLSGWMTGPVLAARPASQPTPSAGRTTLPRAGREIGRNATPRAVAARRVAGNPPA